MEVWVGVARVRPRSGNDLLGSAVGAFVPVVGLAPSEVGFTAAVVNLLDEYGFDVAAVEEVERLRNRALRAPVDPVISELADKLSPDNPVGLGSFHAFLREYYPGM